MKEIITTISLIIFYVIMFKLTKHFTSDIINIFWMGAFTGMIITFVQGFIFN
ncbi:MAG: hypothetical protein U0354_21025 [Candidatus Sericytochromatia bacterium]